MGIFRRLYDYFLSGYRESSTFEQKRAESLLYVNSAMILLLFVIGVVYTLGVGTNVVVAWVTVCAMLVMYSISLVLLKTGRYHFAANLVTIMAAIIVSAAFFNKLTYAPAEGYMTLIFFMFMVAVQATLFCSGRILAGIVLFFIASDIVYFFAAKSIILREGKNLDMIPSIKAAVVESGFSLLFILVLSNLITRNNKVAVDAAESQLALNREQYGKLHALVNTARDITGKLSGSSKSISEKANEMSDTAQSQASAAEEVMATVEEISAGVDNVNASTMEQHDEMRSLTGLIESLSASIGDIGSKISNALGSTEKISGTAEEGGKSLALMNEMMKKINESSIKMTGIVGIINDISDRINLLSLNAAIEAARAGDAGRGFAVVADEISKLADQTATSIKEIDSLIKVNYDEIEKGIKTSDTTVGSIGTIIAGVAEISSIISDINTHMGRQLDINNRVNGGTDRVRVRSDEIRVAMEEQKNAVSEIVRTISDINDKTQTSAIRADALLNESKKLEEMADKLDRTIRG